MQLIISEIFKSGGEPPA